LGWRRAAICPAAAGRAARRQLRMLTPAASSSPMAGIHMSLAIW
jgi:hypothetical protein